MGVGIVSGQCSHPKLVFRRSSHPPLAQSRLMYTKDLSKILSLTGVFIVFLKSLYSAQALAGSEIKKSVAFLTARMKAVAFSGFASRKGLLAMYRMEQKQQQPSSASLGGQSRRQRI